MVHLLAVIPHPDDESYSVAGTLALASRAGWRCTVICLTSGERGEWQGGPPPAPGALGALRERELAASCGHLGAGAPIFWRLPDGALSEVTGGPARLARAIASMAPDLVLSLGRDGAYGHPDHLAAHRWAASAWSSRGTARPALLYCAFPQGVFLPQYEKCLAAGIMGAPPRLRPDEVGEGAGHYAVAIERVRDRKLAAIGAHRSQLPGGDPRALFPPGIVEALLGHEWFSDASGAPQPHVQDLLAGLAPPA